MSVKHLRYYDYLLVFFVSALLISNLSATKLVEFGPIITDGGAIIFPIVYILNDVLTEVYGYKKARRAIWLGFMVMIFAVVSFTIVKYLPSAPEYTSQEAFEAILGFFPRIVLASLLAYLTGTFINSYILAKLKVRDNGKSLLKRLLSSSVVGELFDTIVFSLVAFAGILTANDLLKFILIGWLFKLGVEIVLLPVTYRLINQLKKAEKIDVYDKKTNFSPFHLADE